MPPWARYESFSVAVFFVIIVILNFFGRLRAQNRPEQPLPTINTSVFIAFTLLLSKLKHSAQWLFRFGSDPLINFHLIVLVFQGIIDVFKCDLTHVYTK